VPRIQRPYGSPSSWKSRCSRASVTAYRRLSARSLIGAEHEGGLFGGNGPFPTRILTTGMFRSRLMRSPMANSMRMSSMRTGQDVLRASGGGSSRSLTEAAYVSTYSWPESSIKAYMISSTMERSTSRSPARPA
jgi:hypothetical protein